MWRPTTVDEIESSMPLLLKSKAVLGRGWKRKGEDSESRDYPPNNNKQHVPKICHTRVDHRPTHHHHCPKKNKA